VIEFIFMLTHNDVTVEDALEVFDEVRDSGLRYIGFKDIGPPPHVLTEVTRAAHDAGMEVMLEVVSTSAEDERASIEAALSIGVDWVLGGTNPETGLKILQGSDVRYCPFPGTVVGHPSVLEGSVEAIADHARELTAMDGVHGLDLLAYRHETADVDALVRAVVEASDGPVIAAGSVVGFDQIERLANAGAWGFTIGGAIFEGKLPGAPDVAAQVRSVLEAAAASGPAAMTR
jgi:hypothetical protein